jgi:hypothetical protein
MALSCCKKCQVKGFVSLNDMEMVCEINVHFQCLIGKKTCWNVSFGTEIRQACWLRLRSFQSITFYLVHLYIINLVHFLNDVVNSQLVLARSSKFQSLHDIIEPQPNLRPSFVVDGLTMSDDIGHIKHFFFKVQYKPF